MLNLLVNFYESDYLSYGNNIKEALVRSTIGRLEGKIRGLLFLSIIKFKLIGKESCLKNNYM